MIEIKMASENDIPLIKNLSNKPIKENVDFYMMTIDGANLLGYAAVTLPSNSFAIIKELYILPSERGMGLGDGLLRATLNALDLRGIQWVLIEGNEKLSGFLDHEALNQLSTIEIPNKLISLLENWNKDYYKKKYYFCEPREFFSRKCKGNKKMRR